MIIVTKAHIFSQEKSYIAQSGGKLETSNWKFYLEAKRVMEINPNHPIMEKLLVSVESKSTENLAHIPVFLYEVYSVASGYEARQPSVFADRVERALRSFVGVDQNVKVEEHIEPAPKPVVVAEEEEENQKLDSKVGEKTTVEDVESVDDDEL